MLLLFPSGVMADEIPVVIIKDSTMTFTYADESTVNTTGDAERTYALTDAGWNNYGAITRAVFDSSFAKARPKSTANWFYSRSSMTEIEGIENLNTDSVTNMQRMFTACKNLASLDLSSFNTENVTDMSNMFNGCSSLTSLDLGRFNTKKVTNMNQMFCNCSKLTSVNLSSFDIGNVSGGRTRNNGIGGMFYGCSSLTSLDISNFDTSKLLGLREVFSGCSKLSELKANFNTENCTTLLSLFRGCSSLKSFDLSEFNMDKVTTADNLFNGCSGLTSINVGNHDFKGISATAAFKGVGTPDNPCILIIGEKFDTASIAPIIESNSSKYHLWLDGVFCLNGEPTAATVPFAVLNGNGDTLTFYYADKLDADSWGGEGNFSVYNFSNSHGEQIGNAGKITTAIFDKSFASVRPKSMARWFYGMSGLTKIESIEYLNTDSVTDMSEMFYSCSSLTSLDLSSLNTENVTNMNSMFAGCSGLTSLDLSSLNTENVTYMNGMFGSCSALTSLDLSGLNTENVTGMNGMFSRCSALTSLDLSKLNTQNVTSMGFMFQNCSSLTSLDVTNFNTQNVGNMQLMFAGCSGLTSIDVGNFNTQNVYSFHQMFADCSGLTSLDVRNFDTQKATDMYGMFFGCSNLTGIDISNFNTQKVKFVSNILSGCNSLRILNLGNNDFSNISEETEFFAGVGKEHAFDGLGGTLSCVLAIGKDFNKSVLGEKDTNNRYSWLGGYFTDAKVGETVEIKKIGYATFAPKNDIDYSQNKDVRAFKAKYDDGSQTIILTEIKKAPANTPVVLMGSEGFYLFEVSDEKPGSITNNELQVSSSDIVADGTQWIFVAQETSTNNAKTVRRLANAADGVGFEKVTDGTVIKAGTVYLTISSGKTNKDRLGIGDIVTGIQMQTDDVEKASIIYHVNGMRLDNLKHGLNIVHYSNGTVRKIAVR